MRSVLAVGHAKVLVEEQHFVHYVVGASRLLAVHHSLRIHHEVARVPDLELRSYLLYDVAVLPPTARLLLEVALLLFLVALVVEVGHLDELQELVAVAQDASLY